MIIDLQKIKDMEYIKITELEIVELIMTSTMGVSMGPGIISPSNIASLLKTSRYQVDKHIRNLKHRGIVRYKSIPCMDEEDYYPPYNGYELTEKAKDNYKVIIEAFNKREAEIIKACFGE